MTINFRRLLGNLLRHMLFTSYASPLLSESTSQFSFYSGHSLRCTFPGLSMKRFYCQLLFRTKCSKLDTRISLLDFALPHKCMICLAHHLLDVNVKHVLVQGRSEWPQWTLPALLIIFFSVSKVVVCLFFFSEFVNMMMQK